MKSLNIGKIYKGSNEIGDKGLDFLSDSINFNESLDKLFIFQNLITEHGMKGFCNKLKENNNIQELSLGIFYQETI